jgi:preprotein translocase SecE subunit
MENKKSPGVISLTGFVVAIAGIIVSMVGIGKFVGSGMLLGIPTSLFLLYLGYAITAAGAIAWTVGVLKGWDDVPEDKACAGLRVFGVMPFIAGIVTLFGGVRDYTGKEISLAPGSNEAFMSVKMFLIVLGAIIAVVGLAIWGIGFLKSKVKTTIMLRGSCTRAKKLRDFRSELKKISWLSWRDTYKQSGVVLVTLIAFAIVVGVIDLLFNKALNDWILGLFK